MLVTYDKETELYGTLKGQPDILETCKKRDVVKRGKYILERYVSAKDEFNDWVTWVEEIDEAKPIGYVPNKLTGTYTETLLEAMNTWLENNQ